jgi:hypothetical protein
LAIIKGTSWSFKVTTSATCSFVSCCVLQPCACSLCGFAGWITLFRRMGVLHVFILSGAEALCLVAGHRVESQRIN